MPAFTRERESKKRSQRAVQRCSTFQPIVQTSTPSNNSLPNSNPSWRKIAAYTLKGIAFTGDSFCKAIVFCLDQIPRAECAAYLANSGYGQPKREALAYCIARFIKCSMTSLPSLG